MFKNHGNKQSLYLGPLVIKQDHMNITKCPVQLLLYLLATKKIAG